MAVAGLALGAAAVGAGVFYLLESPTSPVPYATSRCAVAWKLYCASCKRHLLAASCHRAPDPVASRETPHEAGPLKGILQGIPDIMWPENKNPFGAEGEYYEHKVCPC